MDAQVPLTSQDPLHFVNPNLDSFLTRFEPCSPTEIWSIIKDLKNTKENKDTAPIKLIKANSVTLSVVISRMINHAMELGIFPNPLKIGTISPIFKKRGDPSSPLNYRPICKSPYLSKIFEKVIHSRLSKHLTDNNIISPLQFGFRKNISTLDAIIHFTEILYNALNDRNSCMNILIDYSRAFDTVNHEILLKKLDKYGVRGIALALIANYLKDRVQMVRIREKVSDPIVTNISVPQGSINGPLLFLVYITEIPSISQKLIPTMFADDCTLSLIGNDMVSMVEECNRELQAFKLWSDSNRLTINVSKTHCLLISNIFSEIPPGSLLINEQEIDLVQCVKFLGIFIDSGLKFDSHIEYISGKISKSIGIIYRIRCLLPISTLKNLYFSLIQPYIMYCLPIFACTYDTHMQPLILLQKRAIRTISNAPFRETTNPLFIKNNILKINDLYKHSLCCYLYKNQHLIENHTRNHDYFTRHRNDIHVPNARLRSTEQSVIRNALLVWNDIPDNLRACRTFTQFKIQLKKYLIDQYSKSDSQV